MDQTCDAAMLMMSASEPVVHHVVSGNPKGSLFCEIHQLNAPSTKATKSSSCVAFDFSQTDFGIGKEKIQ